MEKNVSYQKYNGFYFIRIFNPVYKRTVEIWRWDVSKAAKVNWLVQKIPDYDEPFKWICLSEWPYTVIWLQELTRQTLLHELQHAMFRWHSQIFEWIEINQPTEEFFTYNMWYCLDCILASPLAKYLKRSKIQ